MWVRGATPRLPGCWTSGRARSPAQLVTYIYISMSNIYTYLHPGKLVSAVRTLGREDAAAVVMGGCSLYRIVPGHKGGTI